MSSMGLGVVVTTERGCCPSLRAKERLSQVWLGYCHEASSSHQAASNCGPLSWSGSWLENTRACAPLGQVSFALGWLVGGHVPMRGDVQNARLSLDHDGLCFVEGAGDEGNAGCLFVFNLIAYPLGACARLAESSSGENEPGVPVAIGGQLGLAGVQVPVVSEPRGLPCWKVAHVDARGGAALVLGQRFNMGCDGVYTGNASECGQYLSVYSHYVSGGSPSSECEG